MLTVGAVRSEVTETGSDAVFPFPAASTAASATTVTVTGPSAVGVMVKVYVCGFTVTTLDIAPLFTSTPAVENPFTFSLNVAVNGSVAAFVGLVAEVVRVAVGA